MCYNIQIASNSVVTNQNINEEFHLDKIITTVSRESSNTGLGMILTLCREGIEIMMQDFSSSSKEQGSQSSFSLNGIKIQTVGL